jgi:AcrR family transcriptional regulator
MSGQGRDTSLGDASGVPLVAHGSLEAREDIWLEALPRHRHGLSRGTVRASQAARILIATTEVVAARGFAGATARAIAQQAGVSQKTFYEIFENKEEAFLAAYAAIDLLIERISAAALAQSDPRDMIRAGLRAYLDTLAGEPAASRMFVIEAVGAGPRVLERRAQAFRDFAAALTVPLDLAHAADPSLPLVDETLLLALLGGINELILQHLVCSSPSTLPELAAPITRLIDRVCFPNRRH